MADKVYTEHWYPEHVKEIAEYKGSIIPAYDKELYLAWQDRDELMQNRFLSTMDADECAIWENMLGIIVTAGETLEERRLEIKSRWLTGLPYTTRKLDEVLQNICGEDGYVLSVDKANKSVVVTLKLAVITKTDYIFDLARQMIPADMELEVKVLFNRWQVFAPHLWDDLKTSTWNSIYSDESWSEEE